MAVSTYGFFPFTYTTADTLATLQFSKGVAGTNHRSRVKEVDLELAAYSANFPLPNGAVYDAFQTYDAPVKLGLYPVSWIYFVNSNGVGDANSDNFIRSLYSDFHNTFIGSRGTLTLKNPFSYTTTCTVRFETINTKWPIPLHDAVIDEGMYANSLECDFIFQRLTQWEV